MGRLHSARRLAMQLLYQLDLRESQPADILALGLASSPSEPETKQLAEAMAQGAWQQHMHLDAEIVKRSQHWALDRMTKVDVAILRLALYELQYQNTPPQVVVNEAVELAKEFSDPDAPKFVNGILGVDLQPLPRS